ncbi:hypothetical protein PSHT_15224 [Puccinia striiformis]|uniref:Uncharacterized protein n=1 Tax=Puccinia striiformis TaxID=27350 RepID=A0A2S4UG59_9BASI|nr:hypothetical protein PSHT_15224 [Puccinia striiformis]
MRRQEQTKYILPGDQSEVCKAEEKLLDVKVLSISQILVQPAVMSDLPSSPPMFTCDVARKKFQGGFHNTCCSKDLDLAKFTAPKAPFAKLDRATFDKFCTDTTPTP